MLSRGFHFQFFILSITFEAQNQNLLRSSHLQIPKSSALTPKIFSSLLTLLVNS
ncbi:hypothetical protein SADUNF_Sadunf10G0063100 [Salix dunnii]|uniref:Uncharacterized protein n=1 Tax=Salix dunnii TaxID=1413687 RepID=A0A835JSN6_9ROSI|nr:hypothetical protein SADUNF_Sadunf10G0063100 [Salix dunnii]